MVRACECGKGIIDRKWCGRHRCFNGIVMCTRAGGSVCVKMGPFSRMQGKLVYEFKSDLRHRHNRIN